MQQKGIWALIALFGAQIGLAQAPISTMEPISFSAVTINDAFWKPKQDLLVNTTLKACIYQTETATPRLKNFQKVARKKG
ncbi:MAG TPA: hypothetical protein PLZ97_07645, partial [Sediminibacterium sp.]|nr:hypothetical protein [Sediminibacterium sp.]